MVHKVLHYYEKEKARIALVQYEPNWFFRLFGFKSKIFYVFDLNKTGPDPWMVESGEGAPYFAINAVYKHINKTTIEDKIKQLDLKPVKEIGTLSFSKNNRQVE